MTWSQCFHVWINAAFTTSGENQLHFVPGASVAENLQRFWTFHFTTALGFDIPRAAGNAALILVVGGPVLGALRRASRKAAFEAPVVFLDGGPLTVEPVRS